MKSERKNKKWAGRAKIILASEHGILYNTTNESAKTAQLSASL